MPRRWTMILAASALASCSMGKGVAPAEAAIETFHHDLKAGQFTSIYAAASGDMKSATSEQAFAQLLAAVHRKLGLYRSGTFIGWNDNHMVGGEFVTVNVAAIYDRGKAQESFVYRITDKGARLAGYHIGSEALILN